MQSRPVKDKEDSDDEADVFGFELLDLDNIVEEKDATEQQKQITEVNMSMYVFQPQALLHSLDQIGNDNRQGEFYITDCPGILRAEGQKVLALAALKPCEALSINNLEELKLVENEMLALGY